jgi:hypothetical protein
VRRYPGFVFREELDPAQFQSARATLGALAQAPEVRELLAEDPARNPIASLRLRGGLWLLGAVGCGAALLFVFTFRRPPVKGVAALGIFGLISLWRGVKSLWTSWRLTAERQVARLAFVAARTRERPVKEDEPERLRATVVCADGERIVFHGMEVDAWRLLRLGRAGVLWTRGDAFVDFRGFGDAAPPRPDALRPSGA